MPLESLGRPPHTRGIASQHIGSRPSVVIGKPGVNFWRIIEVPVEVVVDIQSDILRGHVIYGVGIHALKLTRTSPDIL